MAQIHDTMMNPRIEELLDRVDSKFTLVTLAAQRARQINAYFNQLGEGLGAIVPPQVTSVARKPLSIAFEEIAADKIVAGPRRARRARRRARPTPRPTTTAPVTDRHRPTHAMTSPGAASSSASPGASPPTRPSRSAVASSTPAPTSPRSSPRAPPRFVGATTFSALASEPVQTSLWRRADADPAHPARPDAPTSSSSRRPRPGCSAAYAAGHLRRPAHRHAARHPGAGASSARRCTPRCGSTRRCRTTSPRCARRGVHVVDARARAASPAATSAPAASPTPSRIVAAVERRARRAAATSPGCASLVTAGGTREPIDPVRFIGNRSSGKQGHAIAAEAAARGAEVTLVTTVDRPAPAGVEVVDGRDRRRDGGTPCSPVAADADVVVMAAAVADFRPDGAGRPARSRRTTGVPEIVLEPTADILADLGARKRPGQVLVGLRGRDRRPASPTPRDKLARKGLDLIVGQRRRRRPASGFEHDTNAVVHRRGRRRRRRMSR